MSESLPPLLFDLDGTLVDSRAVVERHWGRFAERHGLDFAAVIMGVAHGVRSRDVIRIARARARRRGGGGAAGCG